MLSLIHILRENVDLDRTVGAGLDLFLEEHGKVLLQIGFRRGMRQLQRGLCLCADGGKGQGRGKAKGFQDFLHAVLLPE